MFESAKVESTASGRVCLVLTEDVTFESFQTLATSFLSTVNGTVVTKADEADARLWIVTIEGARFRLVYDEFPTGMTLESDSPSGDAIVRALVKKLRAKR